MGDTPVNGSRPAHRKVCKLDKLVNTPDSGKLYVEDGCYIHNTCLECPLQHCVLDVSLRTQAAQGIVPKEIIERLALTSNESVITSASLREQAEGMMLKGIPATQISRQLGISHKTLYNWSAEMHEAHSENIKNQCVAMLRSGKSMRSIAKEMEIGYHSVKKWRDSLIENGENLPGVRSYHTLYSNRAHETPLDQSVIDAIDNHLIEGRSMTWISRRMDISYHVVHHRKKMLTDG